MRQRQCMLPKAAQQNSSMSAPLILGDVVQANSDK